MGHICVLTTKYLAPGEIAPASNGQGVVYDQKPPLDRLKGGTYGCMLTGIYGRGVYWPLRMSSPIRRANELTNQSVIPSGLRDLQIVLLLCGLDHLVQGSVWGPLIHGFRWCGDEVGNCLFISSFPRPLFSSFARIPVARGLYSVL